MSKKIAIMQPYLFPYIGYWQLINSVDLFIVFDDVNFIKRGWIHRNQILVSGKPYLFSVPLLKSSQNKLINELSISKEVKWKEKLLSTIKMSYSKAPQFLHVYKLIEEIVLEEEHNLSRFISNQLEKICSYLNIDTNIKYSNQYNNIDLKGQDRIIDIASVECADIYINPEGGIGLYNKADFLQNGIELKFLKSNSIHYSQFQNEFVPWLSIIDILMFNSPKEINKMLDCYQLL